MAAEPKMVPTAIEVDEFLDTVPNEGRRDDARSLIELMGSITEETPKMWGPSIVGFGSFGWRYESGRTGESPLAAFSPRKANLVVYLVEGYEDRYAKLLEKLGPYKAGKACLYLKNLSDVDLDVLRQLIERSTRVARAADVAPQE